MKRIFVLLVVVMCFGVSAFAKDKSQMLKPGSSLSKHLSKLTERYGKGRASENAAPNTRSKGKVMTWKLGAGYLEIAQGQGQV